MSPFGRIFQKIIHDIVVDRLAANPSFQRLAVRIDNFLTSQQSKVKHHAENAKKTAEEMLSEQQRALDQNKHRNVKAEEMVDNMFDAIYNSRLYKAMETAFTNIKNVYDKEFNVKTRK